MDAPLLLSSICEAEILAGLEMRNAAELLRSFEKFSRTVERVAWDSNAAKSYAKLDSYLSRAGLSLAFADRLIAAHALSLNATIVTHDTAFHKLSPYLAVEDWATDL